MDAKRLVVSPHRVVAAAEASERVRQEGQDHPFGARVACLARGAGSILEHGPRLLVCAAQLGQGADVSEDARLETAIAEQARDRQSPIEIPRALVEPAEIAERPAARLEPENEQ